jgi:hypothetical protein
MKYLRGKLNTAPVVERKGTLQSTVNRYLIGIKAGRKKKTFQAYDVALRYFVEAAGDKDLTDITRLDLMVGEYWHHLCNWSEGTYPCSCILSSTVL